MLLGFPAAAPAAVLPPPPLLLSAWFHAPTADGLQLADAEAGGFFRVAQYGPMNSLSTRVNELWLAVKIG